uniref:Ataxin 1 like n=1 Tax=Lepisosteus oculatus TaxID=7918 RepID=W5MA31_LEPOC
MKPAHERNQESLPPKKRDLPGGGEESTSTRSSGSAGSDAPGSGGAGEWMRIQPGVHYSVENSDGIGVPIDQYGMLYKVALPSGTYSPTSLHPVLSHLSPAYTVPSPLLQHPGIPYPPLGYAQIPHSSLQFVGPPYAVPYAVPPGFVPSPLISPQPAIPQSHHVSHLVPYQSVIQEGVVSPPPQPQTATHAFTKVAPAAGVPVVLSSEQAAQQLQHQQHLGAVGGLPAAEVSPRGVPVFYHHPVRAPPAPAAAYRDSADKEVNGGDEEQGGRELLQEPVYSSRNMRVLHVVSTSALAGSPEQRPPVGAQQEEMSSPGHRSTPDTDLEVQQVVGRLASPNQGVAGSRKEVSFGPLNLSQGSHRVREVLPAARGGGSTREPAQHAVILANGQPVLVPLDHHQQIQQQHHHHHHHPGLPNDNVISATTGSPLALPKASEPPARTCLQERGAVAAPPASTPAPAPSHPSHFMKGAIIQLATGELKRVEDLQTQDFVRSAEVSGGLKIDSSMVVDIRKSQQRPGLVSLHFTVGEQQSKVTIDVPPEHPFFVFGQGWSSCSPDRTVQLYGLPCHRLQVGDVCVSLTSQARTSTTANASSNAGAVLQSMGPPAPQHARAPIQHTESHPRSGGLASTTSAAQRRWSAPGFQRYGIKSEEVASSSSPSSSSSSSSSRPSFIPQEVKLSIEGRSNAGK